VVLRLLNSGLSFIILHVLYCYIADLDLLVSFKVWRAGLGAGTGDILWGGGVGVVLEPDLEDIELESLSDLELSIELSVESLIGLAWDLLLDLLIEIAAANLILVYIERPHKSSLTGGYIHNRWL